MNSDTHDDAARSRSIDTRHDSTERPRLVHLKDASHLQVADGDPDIRGWELRTSDGHKVGKVEDLVVDTSVMKVRYIEGQLKFDDRTDDEDRRVLIPIESAHLDEEEDNVIIDFSTIDARTLPAYDSASMPISEVDDDDAFDDRSFFGERRRGREASPYISPIGSRDARDVDRSGSGLI